MLIKIVLFLLAFLAINTLAVLGFSGKNVYADTGYTLSITAAIGSNVSWGNVVSNPAGINCGTGGSACSAVFPPDAAITLTATPVAGKIFKNWQYIPCPGAVYGISSGNPCVMALTTSVTGSVNYDEPTGQVSISKSGDGSGTVTSSPGGINCGSACSASFFTNSTPTLTAIAASGSKFVGWEAPGTSCVDGGKGGQTINSNPVCQVLIYNGGITYTAIAKFEKVAGSTPGAATQNPASSPATSSTPQQTTADGSPVAPTVDITIGNNTVSSSDKPSLEPGQPLLLSGKTVANGIITLYVFSEPKKYTVNADKDGNWSHTIMGLPAGSHHVEAEATDPTTGKTSARTQVLSFIVKGATSGVKEQSQPATTASQRLANNKLGLAGAASSVIILLAVGLLLYLRRFNKALWDTLLRQLHLKKEAIIQ